MILSMIVFELQLLMQPQKKDLRPVMQMINRIDFSENDVPNSMPSQWRDIRKLQAKHFKLLKAAMWETITSWAVAAASAKLKDDFALPQGSQ